MRARLGVLRYVLANSGLRRVELAFLGFGATEYGVWVAVLVYAYRHGGATMAAAIAVLQLLPAAVVAPFGANLADRRGGADVLRLGYLVQTVSLAFSAVSLLLGAPPAVVYLGAVVAASAVTLTRPAQGALLPVLVRTPDELSAANVVTGWVESSSLLLGPALAGVLITINGSGLALAVFAGVVLVSAVLVFRLRAPAQTDRSTVGSTTAEQLVEAPLQVLAMLRRSPGVTALFVLIATESAVEGAMDVLEVVLAINVLSLGPGAAGYLGAAFGAGAIVGGVATITLVGRPRLAGVLLASGLIWGVAFLAIGAWPVAAVAFAMFAGAGTSRALLGVATRTILHRVVPAQLHGRVFGILEAVTMLGLAVGSLLVPVAIAVGGPRAALVGLGALLVVVALLSARALRALERDAPDLAMELSLLRGSPLFRMLAAPELEDLARSLVRDQVPAGVAITLEGEPGDCFYFVADGEFVVAAGGSESRRLGSGYGFGEIALLRDGVRTATVTAVVPSTVYGLHRAPFIAALTGSYHARRAADELMGFHLREKTPSGA